MNMEDDSMVESIVSKLGLKGNNVSNGIEIVVRNPVRMPSSHEIAGVFAPE